MRSRYGPSAFGQGCLMARRMIESGVTFVEVQSSGWDTHGNELTSLRRLIPPVDQGTAALLTDLHMRGLLERTLVIWMGEFGRTPRVNLSNGRDHFPEAFNMAMADSGSCITTLSVISKSRYSGSKPVLLRTSSSFAQRSCWFPDQSQCWPRESSRALQPSLPRPQPIASKPRPTR